MSPLSLHCALDGELKSTVALLPKEYGYWNSIYRRFARWSEQGIFHELHQALCDDADLEHLLIDSTIIRAHPCAAGARKKVATKKAKR